MATKTADSAAIARFRAQGVYEHEATPRQLAQHVQELREQARQHGARRSTLGWVCFGCFALGLLLLVVGAASDQGPLLVLGLTGLISGIVLAVAYARTRLFDVSSIETLERLSVLLAADMAPDAALRVRLDLQRPDHQSKLERTGAVGQWKVRYFTNPWLRLGGRLLDGTSFQLGLVTAHQARTKTKRSASGKTKTKRKTKQSMRARLRLQVKPARYPGLTTIAQQAGRDAARIAKEIHLPAPASIEALDVTADALTLGARLGPVDDQAMPPHHAAAMMFLGLYRVLNFARANDKSQQPGGEA